MPQLKSYLPLKLALTFLLALLLHVDASPWGFWGHQRINRISVFTLPPEMYGFYKYYIEYITENAVNPDQRRYAVQDEAPRHYIDLDHFCVFPCDSFPRKWKDAVGIYTEDSLLSYGIVPWHVDKMTYRLTEAFKAKDRDNILRLSADLGHYIADAHVPLHTTENYNGQLTNQVGIHGFWESRVPELFGEDYDYFVGKAEYLDYPLEKIWEVVLESHSMLDSVLSMEKKLSQEFPPDQIYSYEKRGATTVRVYSEAYSKAYDQLLGNMAERRMRASMKNVGNFWFTAWVNAGQPDLSSLIGATPEELPAEPVLPVDSLNSKKIYGREHPNTGLE